MEHRQRPHRHDGNNIKIRSLVVVLTFVSGPASAIESPLPKAKDDK